MKQRNAYNQLSDYKTMWNETANGGAVTYHKTCIVEWSEHSITLRSGGWETVTTKKKLNQSAHQFGLGFSVYQTKGNWFVDLPNGETVPFIDRITFARA